MSTDKLPLDEKALDALLSRLRERCSRGAWSSGVMVGTRYEGQAILDLVDSLRQQARAALSLAAQVEKLTEALEGVRDYFDQRADADAQGDPMRYVANAEMNRLYAINEALNSTPPSALAALRAQVRADALREAADICSRQESCETDLGSTYCEERYAAAILAAANAQDAKEDGR